MGKKSSKMSRNIAFIICFFSYVIALIVAILITIILPKTIHPIFIALIADIGATLTIYLFNVVFNNASLYDPYWSVAPIPIAFYWLSTTNSTVFDLTIRQILVLFLVIFWGGRLTYNWARGWGGMSHVDWRYEKLRKENPKYFWLINLTGIELMPTILVFLGCLSLYPVLTHVTTPFNILDVTATIVTFTAIMVEAISDQQLIRFSKNKKQGEIINEGLWKHSRHPNYFGEVSFWWGLYLFCLATDPQYWWTIIGPVSITLLFIFISIPMIEERLQERYEEYEKYKRSVPMFLPIRIR